jgi:hypothetical protein
MSPARPDAAPAVKPIEVSSALKALMRRLKLGQLLDTLPERLALARSNRLPHHDFLEMLLADEVTRRDRQSAARRAKAAHLDPQMQLQASDDSAAVNFDHQLWAELISLAVPRRRLQRTHHGTGRSRKDVPSQRFRAHRGPPPPQRAHRTRRQAVQTLRGARLDGSYEDEMRKLHRVELLDIDDLALHRLEATETSDFYELIVERHRAASTIITSNSEPPEILTMMADPLLAQSAMDRLQSAAFELVVEGESYGDARSPSSPSRLIRTSRIDRQRFVGNDQHTARDRKNPVPCSCRNGGPITVAGDRFAAHMRRITTSGIRPLLDPRRGGRAVPKIP